MVCEEAPNRLLLRKLMLLHDSAFILTGFSVNLIKLLTSINTFSVSFVTFAFFKNRQEKLRTYEFVK